MLADAPPWDGSDPSPWRILEPEPPQCEVWRWCSWLLSLGLVIQPSSMCIFRILQTLMKWPGASTELLLIYAPPRPIPRPKRSHHDQDRGLDNHNQEMSQKIIGEPGYGVSNGIDFNILLAGSLVLLCFDLCWHSSNHFINSGFHSNAASHWIDSTKSGKRRRSFVTLSCSDILFSKKDNSSKIDIISRINFSQLDPWTRTIDSNFTWRFARASEFDILRIVSTSVRTPLTVLESSTVPQIFGKANGPS